MKRILLLLCLAGCLLSTQCRTYKGFNTWFCTNKAQDTICYLYIDGINKGSLPYLPESPDCGNNSLREKALFMHLESGKYKLEVKDQQSKLFYSGTIVIKRSGHSISLSSSTSQKNAAEVKFINNNDCLINYICFE